MPPEPARTRSDELARLLHQRREMSRQQLLKRWRDWELDISIVTDAHASTCLFFCLPMMLYVTREVEWGRTAILVCVAACMLVCVAHLFCVYARRQWYVRNRTPTIVALRMALVCFLLSTWVFSSWRLRRSQETGSRVMIGMFMSLGYNITNQLLQLELQFVLLVITRAVLFYHATRREGLECSYIGICRKSVDGVDVGHMHLWDTDVPYEERTATSRVPFAYSFDGFLFDALLYVVLPLAVTNMKQRAREVTFAREERRREEEARRRRRRGAEGDRETSELEFGADFEGAREGSQVSRPPPSAAARDEFEEAFEGYGEGFENDAGDAIASSRSRALSFPRRLLLGLRRVSRQIMPLMEFPDDALEKRFNQWHRRAMLRVDLTRAAISCCTSLLWYQKFRMYTTSSAASFLPLHAMTYLFAVNLFQVYFLLGHTQTYLRVRNAALTFGKLNMAATFFVTRAALAAANAAILVQHYKSYPRLAAPEGELSALRAWLAETAWLVPAYVPEPSAGPEMPDLLVVSIEVKVFAVLLQFFGTHQLMRTNVNIALFTVFSACVLEPAVFSQPPDAALPIRSKLFPSIHKFTRLTNIFVDLSFLFLTGYLAERHLRASFAKEINLEMRQAEFMRSPLARLRMTVAPFPPGAPRTAAGEDWDPSPRTRQISAAEQERRGVEGETEWEADTGGGASAGGRGRGRGGREATTSARLRPDERLRRRSRARNGRGDA
jgi:hypothetical protein